MATVNTGATGVALDVALQPDSSARQAVVIGDPVGTQTASVSASGALKVEPAINVGRTRFTLAISTTAPPTSATIQSASPIRAGVAGSGATSHSVTAGKRLRITSMSLAVRSTSAAVPWALAELRSNPAGATTASSPMVLYLGAGGTTAASGNTGTASLSIEEGVEFTASETIGVTLQGNVNTNVVQVTLLGYEY